MRAAPAVAAIAVAMALGPSAAIAAPANLIGGDANPMAANPDVFNPTSYDHEAGATASLTWAAGGAHDADATQIGPDGGPLFRSELTRSVIPVAGTQFLSLGAYPFFCTVHAGMTGTLNVNSGTPLPRPELTMKVLSTRLEQVVKSSKLRVKATLSSPGDGIQGTITARLGKRTIASGTATATRTISLKLSKQGAKTLVAKKTARLKLGGEIDFGAPAKASGTLR